MPLKLIWDSFYMPLFKKYDKAFENAKIIVDKNH